MHEGFTYMRTVRGYMTKIIKVSINFFIIKYLVSQTDEVAAGFPIGLTLANIFLRHHEIIWFKKCLKKFRPNYYKRFVNMYMKKQNANIRFSMEAEKNGVLHFFTD